MKRFITALLLCLALSVVVSSRCAAVYPAPDGTMDLDIELGYYDDNEAWFICTATNNVSWAYSYDLTLAPKLQSALAGAAQAVYVVTNYNQGPVFSTAPGQAAYSALWRVTNLTWAPTEIKRPITNTDPASPGNPNGIPAAGMAQQVTSTVLDCSIVAMNRLGGPWLPKPRPFYRIPQAIMHNPYAKKIRLPTWAVFCEHPLTRQPMVEHVIIPDAGDTALASTLGANRAPGLMAMPVAGTERFYVMRFPRPPSQLPIIECLPTYLSWRNRNYCYSPIMQYVVLHRNIPPYAVVDNPTYAAQLVTTGGLVVVGSNQRIHSPVVTD